MHYKRLGMSGKFDAPVSCADFLHVCCRLCNLQIVMEDLSNYPNPYEVYDQNGTNHFGDSNYGSADGGYDSGSFGSNEGFDTSNQYVKDKFNSGYGDSYGDYSNEYKDAYTRDSGSIEDDQEQRDR